MERLTTHRELAGVLARVERPGRYVGGEYGSIVKEGEGLLRVVISYPDLYEVAMSNAAVRILYGLLNGIEGVACERVFAPAPDFEAALSSRGAPLSSLETGRAVRSFDIVAFSIGYELTLTNLLAILALGRVPVRGRERGPGDPVVIAGGPATTNPLPLAPFIDAVFIGEAEGWIEGAFSRLAERKRRGAGRDDLLELLRRDPSIWYPGRGEPVRRALWRGFAATPSNAVFPVPNIRVVQDHGTVEIMRGCPNSCRFCHAGVYYRPCRRKQPEATMAEVAALIRSAGYREVTLSSLSTGDYPGIYELVCRLNSVWANLRVSFSLPSLRVDSLALKLLGEVSQVRKSGLTFAVETPTPEWQAQLRKLVPLEKTVSILREAKELGWRSAKFYFMVGLPPAAGADEAGPVIAFLRAVRRETGMELAVNVAAFIPKSHTPWERAAQLGEQDALERIMKIRQGLHGPGFRVGYHAPFASLLEGIVARGDERAGELVFEAWRRGARLDAWEDHLRDDIWRAVIAEAGWDVIRETCRERAGEERLPWEGIGLTLSRSEGYEQLPPSDRRKAGTAAATEGQGPPSGPTSAPRRRARMLFSFTKTGRAAWIGHLDLMGVVERTLARAGLAARFTEGFNPKPRLEFASPLALGLESEEEIAAVDLEDSPGPEAFARRMSAAFPEGLEVTKAVEAPELTAGKRRPSLMSRFWGADYRVEPGGATTRLAKNGPKPRSLAGGAGADGHEVRIVRVRTLATATDGTPTSYFELFRSSSLS